MAWRPSARRTVIPATGAGPRPWGRSATSATSTASTRSLAAKPARSSAAPTCGQTSGMPYMPGAGSEPSAYMFRTPHAAISAMQRSASAPAASSAPGQKSSQRISAASR